MNRRLNLTGKHSNDIYMIAFPHNLLGFIKYDFAAFMERANDLCRLYVKTGDYKPEEVAEIRASIGGCHKYYEQNIRTVFEKIVIDCWIEYICRQNDYGVVTMWNNYLPCRNDFERAVFTRLSEYRHNRAINQWVNLLRIQEYATRKTDFIFSQKLRGSAQAASRANYFDLIYNVAANEMGFDLSALADNHVFSIGRTPNSPFILSGVSREIVRNLLEDTQPLPDARRHYNPKAAESVSDQTAMDAFSAVKQFIPENPDNIVNTMIKSLPGVPYKIYVPGSFKAVIDLEIDALIESGGILQRCKRCNDYYVKDEGYNYDYCDRVNREGRSCIEIMRARAAKGEAVVLTTHTGDNGDNADNVGERDKLNETHAPGGLLELHELNNQTEERPPELRFDTNIDTQRYNEAPVLPIFAPNSAPFEPEALAADLSPGKNPPHHPEIVTAFSLHERCDELYKKMSMRVGADITQRDFADWFRYLSIMRENVQNGEASLEDFADFERYSLSMTFAADHRRSPEPQKQGGYANPSPRNGARPAQTDNPSAGRFQNGQNSHAAQAGQNSQAAQAGQSVTADGKTIKPFIFERVDKSQLQAGGIVSRNADTQFPDSDEEPQLPAYRTGATAHVLRGVAYTYNSQPQIIPTTSGMVNNPNVHPQGFQPPGFDVPKQPSQNVSARDHERQDQEFVRVFEPQNKQRSPQNPVGRANIPAQNPNQGNPIQPIQTAQPVQRIIPQATRHADHPPYLQAPQDYAESAFADFVPERFEAVNRQDGRTSFAEQHSRANDGAESRSDRSDRADRSDNRAFFAEQQGRQRGGEIPPETANTNVLPSAQSNAYATRAYSEMSGAGNMGNMGNAALFGTESKAAEKSAQHRREERDYPGESGAQFSDILRGFDRRDSFADENIPTDADGIPVTHKTKRVMDAIFRQPKSGTIINPAVRDSGEHK